MRTFTIVKEGITIGRFGKENDRDIAFDEYVLPTSKNCFKGVFEK